GGEAAALDDLTLLAPLRPEPPGLGAGAVGELFAFVVEARAQAGAPEAPAVVLADDEQLGLGERPGQAPAVAEGLLAEAVDRGQDVVDAVSAHGDLLPGRFGPALVGRRARGGGWDGTG